MLQRRSAATGWTRLADIGPSPRGTPTRTHDETRPSSHRAVGPVKEVRGNCAVITSMPPLLARFLLAPTPPRRHHGSTPRPAPRDPAMRSAWTLLVALLVAVPATAAPADFDRDIKPILTARCVR